MRVAARPLASGLEAPVAEADDEAIGSAYDDDNKEVPDNNSPSVFKTKEVHE
jgi:hypothetical protein